MKAPYPVFRASAARKQSAIVQAPIPTSASRARPKTATRRRLALSFLQTAAVSLLFGSCLAAAAAGSTPGWEKIIHTGDALPDGEQEGIFSTITAPPTLAACGKIAFAARTGDGKVGIWSGDLRRLASAADLPNTPAADDQTFMRRNQMVEKPPGKLPPDGWSVKHLAVNSQGTLVFVSENSDYQVIRIPAKQPVDERVFDDLFATGNKVSNTNSARFLDFERIFLSGDEALLVAYTATERADESPDGFSSGSPHGSAIVPGIINPTERIFNDALDITWLWNSSNPDYPVTLGAPISTSNLNSRNFMAAIFPLMEHRVSGAGPVQNGLIALANENEISSGGDRGIFGIGAGYAVELHQTGDPLPMPGESPPATLTGLDLAAISGNSGVLLAGTAATEGAQSSPILILHIPDGDNVPPPRIFLFQEPTEGLAIEKITAIGLDGRDNVYFMAADETGAPCALFKIAADADSPEILIQCGTRIRGKEVASMEPPGASWISNAGRVVLGLGFADGTNGVYFLEGSDGKAR